MSRTFNHVLDDTNISLSADTLSAAANVSTSSVSTTATNSNGGTLTYTWQQSGTTCTINTSTASSTTFTGSSTAGSTTVYCNITNSVTGVTTTSPVCIITWSISASITDNPVNALQHTLTATLTGATATNYLWSKVSGTNTVGFSPNNSVSSGTTTASSNTQVSCVIQCVISYSGGSITPNTTVVFGPV